MVSSMQGANGTSATVTSGIHEIDARLRYKISQGIELHTSAIARFYKFQELYMVNPGQIHARLSYYKP